MKSYPIMADDYPPEISIMYQDVDMNFKIGMLDTSYFDYQRVDGVPSCPRLKATWKLLCDNFNLYYATREIGGVSEYDFFCMLQSCLNRNADTFERQLEVYDDDIAKPILGRTEKVTYDTTDKRDSNNTSQMIHGLKIERSETGEEINHNIDVPADNPDYDTDRSRNKLEFNERKTTDQNSGTDKGSNINDETRKTTGTVTTELSDLGVRPNYESFNGFLDNNRTFIQEFINTFEECFAPRYRRIMF